MDFGLPEMIVIVVVVLLLFGATAIPKLARSFGRAQGEFKKAKREFDSEMKRSEAEATATSAPVAPATEDQVRRTARDLGIVEQGKSVDELKLLIQQRLA